MVDPFFTTGNTAGNNGGNNGESSTSGNANTTKSLDTLMAEQTEIQNKYKELKELLHSDDLTQNQIAEIKEQMQNLSNLYSHNKETIAALSTNIAGEKEIHVNKNVKPDESNSKSFSFKKIIIGCGVLFLLLLGGLVAIFYTLMGNTNRLTGFGIDGCTAVNLLQIFSIVFFGILFFVGLALLLINLYKIIVSKNKRKIGFVIGTIFGAAISVLATVCLIFMINKLSAFSSECNDRGNTELADLEIRVKDSKFKNVRLPETEYKKIIAPINAYFKLNSNVYKNTVAPSLGAATVTSIQLDCGNGQTLYLDSDNINFQDSCFYTERGTYTPTVIIEYSDASQTQKDYKISLHEISIASAITIKSEQGQIQTLNSTIIVGENPVNVRYNASDIFKDFNLSTYDIRRSAECNGSRDNISAVDFAHQYNKEGIQDVCVAFPRLSDYIYTFPIRVEQGTIPPAFSINYNITTNRGGSYDDNTSFITISDIPTTLNLKITNITPSSPTIQKKLMVNGTQIPAQFSDTNLFKINIDEEKDYELVLDISDPDKQIQTTKTINISVNRADVVGNLSITPDTVGISPFTVKFDASTTTLNDQDDEIVYFSRDFGDGEKNPNLSESVVSHTYKYDFSTENGVYYPTVTMTTKKGRTFAITGSIISVKKPDTSIKISLDDHPAQIAKIGDIVSMSLSLDGMPKQISRDFGDGETLECDGRFCTSTTHIYQTAGSYSISAKIEFDGKPTLEGRIALVVQ